MLQCICKTMLPNGGKHTNKDAPGRPRLHFPQLCCPNLVLMFSQCNQWSPGNQTEWYCGGVYSCLPSLTV
jgi:hypothetical protein